MEPTKKKNWIWRIFKWIGYTLGSIVLLLVILWFVLKTAWAQNIIREKAVAWLENKFKTRVDIKKVDIDYLYHLQIDGIYLEDKSKQPLAYIGKLEASYKLLDLLDNQLTLSSVEVDSLKLNVYNSTTDSVFNYDFITKAFAGTEDPNKAKDTSTGTEFKFDVKDVVLSRADLAYHDLYGGQQFDIDLKKLDLELKEFNLDSLFFTVDHLYTENLDAKILFTKSSAPKVEKEDDTTTSSLPVIKADTIQLLGTKFIYNDSASATALNTIANKLGLSGAIIDLNRMDAKVKTIVLADHTASFAMKSENTTEKKTDTVSSDSTSKPFTFAVNKIVLDNNNVQFDDNSTSYKKSNAINFTHLLLNELNADIGEIVYDGKTYQANVNEFRMKEQSGFEVKKLTAKAVYGEQQIKLDKAIVITNNSTINALFLASYASLDELSNRPGNTAIQAGFVNTKVNLRDLLYVQPDLAKNEYIKPLIGKDIFLNTQIRGKIGDLTISQLQIKEGNILLNASAHVTGLPDAGKMKIDLKLNQFSGTRAALLALLPKDLIPSSVHIPDKFTVKGTYKGTMEDINADILLTTSSGNVSVKGVAKNLKDSINATYDAVVKTDELRLDKFLGDTSFGAASVNLKVKGRGYAIKTADIEMEGDVAKLQMRGYTYSNMKLKGKLSNNQLVANLNSADPNLLANIDLAYNMDPNNPTLKVNSDSIYVDLQKLGFYPDPLRIKTVLAVDMQSADPDKLQGVAALTGLQVAFKEKIFPIDSLKITAKQIGDSNSIDLETPVITANLKGLYKLTTLGETVTGIVNHYIADTAITTPLPKNEALLTATVRYHEIIKSFVPDLRQMTDIPIYLYLNSDSQKIQFSTAAKTIRYGEYIIDSLQLNADTKNDSLLYDLRIDKLRNPSVPLNKTFVYGAVKNGDIGWNIRLLDRRDRDNYGLSGVYITDSAGVSELKLKPLLLINKQIWQANEDNSVRFDKDGLAGGNLELKYQNNSLEIKSGAEGGMPVDVNFKSFSIQTITNLIQLDTVLADGFINGSVHLASANPLAVSADLTIDSIQVYNQPVGQLRLLAKNTSTNVFNVDAKFTGTDLDMSIAGNYTNEGDGGLDFVLDMPNVGLKSVQPFLKDIATNMGGALTGRMTVQGTVAKPAVRGAINFKNAQLTYVPYSTFIKLPDERIDFTEQGIVFKDFTIQDSLSNPIAINGNIATTDYKNFEFGLNLAANNFLAINRRLSPEQLIYGPAWIDARLNVKGTLDLPVIDGQVKLRDNSTVTVVIPSEDPEVETRRGIIRFVDKSIIIDSSLLVRKAADTAEAEIKGLSASFNAEITPESSLTIILDEQNGDSLQVKGNANLNITMDPSGKTSMTGRYTVSEGSYVLSLSQFIKRKFSITKDGTITWAGDPTAATLDLAAVYNVNTAPEQLLQDQTATQGERLRQKLPFEVILTIKGEMLKPAIAFKLDMPEREQNALDGVVYTRIKQINNDVSELNKQVMGLLVLNNFISDNPFQSLQSGTTPEMIARRTAGKILSQQLNNLVGNIIKGVDINFDVESQEDYSTGSLEQQTNVNVGVSKRLFNDRTTVSVGSSVPVEGQRQTSAPLVGNVTVDYKLTRDGRYRVKVYRRTDNTAFLQGEVVETGVGFTLVMDYNEFKEILRRSRRDRQLKEDEKKAKEKKKNNKK